MQANNHGRESQNHLLLRKLSQAINDHAAAATFACGGSVPLAHVPVHSKSLGKRRVCSPIKIRWDADPGSKASINFPPNGDDSCFSKELDALLRKCQPATFGIGDKDILDEGYRKANVLDTSAFSMNFHPHDCGIIDSIQQILMPSTIRGGQGVGSGPQGVEAELYKLNVCTEAYSAPKPYLP